MKIILAYHIMEHSMFFEWNNGQTEMKIAMVINNHKKKHMNDWMCIWEERPTDYMVDSKYDINLKTRSDIVMVKYLFLSVASVSSHGLLFSSIHSFHFDFHDSLISLSCSRLQINKSHYCKHCFCIVVSNTVDSIEQITWRRTMGRWVEKKAYVVQNKGVECNAHCDGNHQVKYLLLETVHLLDYLLLVLPCYSHGNFVVYFSIFIHIKSTVWLVGIAQCKSSACICVCVSVRPLQHDGNNNKIKMYLK